MWINSVNEDEAAGVVAKIYKGTTRSWGGVDNIIRLRDVGFGDKAILKINQITGFFAWCNRTVDGLGSNLKISGKLKALRISSVV